MSSHLRDLAGLVAEYLECLVTQRRMSWLDKKTLKRVVNELRREPVQITDSRLADFYVRFQSRGSFVGQGHHQSQQLRDSFSKMSKSVSMCSLNSARSVASRASRSSDTVGTGQSKKTNETSHDSSISFTVSSTTQEDERPLGKERASSISEEDQDPSDELPIAVLGKATKRASDPGASSGHVDSGEHAVQRKFGKLVEDVAVQTSTSMSWMLSPSTTRPPPLPRSPQSSPRSSTSKKSKRSSSSRGSKKSAFLLSSVGDPTVSTFNLTSVETMSLALEWTFSHWNPVCCRGTCCKFHAYSTLAQALLVDMNHLECQPLWAPFSGWQCQNCTSLNNELAYKCSFCQVGRHESDTLSSDNSQASTQEGCRSTVEGG